MNETRPDCKESPSFAGSSENEVAIPPKDGYDNTKDDYDTGVTAWLQVLGSFFLYFNSWYASILVFVLPYIWLKNMNFVSQFHI